MSHSFKIGDRVERCNSPAGSLIADGERGVIVEALAAENGEMGYFVRLDDGRRVYSAGSRLRPAESAPR